jgi:hypothetical protein
MLSCLMTLFLITPHAEASLWGKRKLLERSPDCNLLMSGSNIPKHKRKPPKHYNYPDKHDYGFDPVPPSIRIAPGFRDNHYWRLGGWYYGQGDYSPGYDGMLWFGYEIEY